MKRYFELLAVPVMLMVAFPAALKCYGKETKQGGWAPPMPACMHAFNETYIFVGSFNLEPCSIFLNMEHVVYFQSPEYA